MSFRGTSMEEYYRERAAEYDAIYKVPDRQDDLVHLRAWLEEQVRGRTIREIAAGTAVGPRPRRRPRRRSRRPTSFPKPWRLPGNATSARVTYQG
jgi:hypothetical protein